jgi:hypothetical protein
VLEAAGQAARPAAPVAARAAAAPVAARAVAARAVQRAAEWEARLQLLVVQLPRREQVPAQLPGLRRQQVWARRHPHPLARHAAAPEAGQSSLLAQLRHCAA